MPRICTVCRHEERKAIEQSLVHREPIRAIATRFDVSRSALQRHSKHHLPQALAKACEAREIEIGGELLEDLEQLTEDNLSIRSQALDSGDLRTALMANREIRANYELLAKVT